LLSSFFSSFNMGKPLIFEALEHRAGIEPANTGFADLRVSHFATDALGQDCPEN
jgi:hypothetical protein